MKYEDARFARHLCFRYFSLNTEMRWRALQTGRIYVCQHLHDAQLSVEELRDMVGHEGAAFSNLVLHYAASLRGTRQYWLRQRSQFIAMVNTIGLPTVFFTHSAADLQWPEIANLISPDNPDSRSSRNTALLENPAIADWLYHHRIHKFVEAFYVGVFGATDYWLCCEWQHRVWPHVHGHTWLKDAPDVEAVLASHEMAQKTLSSTLTGSLPRPIQLSNQMGATSMMLLPLRQIHTSATGPMLLFKIMTRTWLTSLPRANVTPAVQQCTACILVMANNSVALATPSPFNHG